MNKDLSVVFAALLLVAGGLIIGKTLSNRKAVVTADATCASAQPLTLTSEVRAYIDHEFQTTNPAPTANANEAAFTDQILALEKILAATAVTYNKSKQFMDEIEKLRKNMADWRDKRTERLSTDRLALGLDLMNEGAAKCGVQRRAPPKSAAAPPQPAQGK